MEAADRELLQEAAILGKGAGNHIATRLGISRVRAYVKIRQARERNEKRALLVRRERRRQAARKGWATRRSRMRS